VTSRRTRRAKRTFWTHTADLVHRDRARRDGIPVTSLSRTILDVAVSSRPRTVRRHIQVADDLKLFDLREMEDLLGRTKGHRGQAKVRAALELYEEHPAFTRSGLERRFLEVVTEAGLPAPAMNHFVAGYEIDAWWEAERFGVELDVHETHGSRLSFEEDRERDDELLHAGIETTRVTGPRLDREPGAVVDCCGATSRGGAAEAVPGVGANRRRDRRARRTGSGGAGARPRRASPRR
jgi:hypothetical protein